MRHLVWLLVIGLTLAASLCGCGGSDPAPGASSIPRDRWETVAKTLVDSGSGLVTISPYDPEQPNRMQINVSGVLASDTTDYQIRKVANTAYTRLGDGARVIVVDDTGKTRATSSDLGTDN